MNPRKPSWERRGSITRCRISQPKNRSVRRKATSVSVSRSSEWLPRCRAPNYQNSRTSRNKRRRHLSWIISWVAPRPWCPPPKSRSNIPTGLTETRKQSSSRLGSHQIHIRSFLVNKLTAAPPSLKDRTDFLGAPFQSKMSQAASTVAVAAAVCLR